MTLFLCVLAGAIGANMAHGLMPNRTVAGVLNLVLGMIGGAVAFAAAVELSYLAPGMSILLQLLVIGGVVGALFTLAVGSLRNILRGLQPQARRRHPSPRPSTSIIS